MTPVAYAAYNHVVTTTTSKDRVLILLYEGAVRFVQSARDGMREKKIAAKGENISRTLKILNELEFALDHEIGGDLADNLASLYQYMRRRLTWANRKNDESALEEVEGLLIQLKDAFDQAALMAKSGTPVDVNLPEGPAMRRISFAV